MLFHNFLLADQKGFYYQIQCYSLLILLLEDTILNVMFHHFNLQKTIQKVCLLLENLDQLSDLSIFFHIFLYLIDVYFS